MHLKVWFNLDVRTDFRQKFSGHIIISYGGKTTKGTVGDASHSGKQ